MQLIWLVENMAQDAKDQAKAFKSGGRADTQTIESDVDVLEIARRNKPNARS